MKLFNQLVLVLLGLALVLAVTLVGGLRQGLLALLGIGFGVALQSARFGFTTGWRNYIERRDPQGLWAQLLLLCLAAAITLPIIANSNGEVVGAVAPLTISLVLGAFIFGAAMQLADGCGSGTLYKAGAGAPISFAVLPTFALGSFVGGSHQPAWIALGGLPAVNLLDYGWPAALTATLLACALIAYVAGHYARRYQQRHASATSSPTVTWAKRWWLGALFLAILYGLHSIVAGQPWGIVYGIGLWGAKIYQATGGDLLHDPFWGVAPHAQRLSEPVLADITSVTNFGLIFGALAASRWNLSAAFTPPSQRTLWIGALAGLIMGYSSRMAFGCNVGAFLGGIASASLHGWIWFAMAFAGSMIGVRIRRRVNP